MNMPGMDGLALLKPLHALDARLPVIMVTANEHPRAAADAQTAGAFASVPESIDVRHLVRVAPVFPTQQRTRSGAPGGPSPR